MEDTKTMQQELAAAQEELQELKSKLEKATDFMENASIPLHWVDSKGIIIWANQAELDLLGYTKEEYIGQSIDKFHVDKKGIQTILRRLQNNEIIKNFPAQLIRKDGSLREVLIGSSTYRQNGEFIHTKCFTRDITDLKKEEEEKIRERLQASRSIEESETRFRLAIEAAEMGVFDWDLSAQTFFFISPSY